MQISREQVLKVLEAHLQKQGHSVEKHASALPTAFELRELKTTIAKIPEVRLDRVKRIEDRIRDGKYTVDDDEVAEKIVFRAAVDRVIILDD